MGRTDRLMTFAALAAVSVSLGGPAQAAPAETGLCEVWPADSDRVLASIAWSRSEDENVASLNDGGRDLDGEVLHVRREGRTLKVNLALDDGEGGFLEALVVLPDAGRASIMAVRFIEAGGEWVVDDVIPFADAVCLVR